MLSNIREAIRAPVEGAYAVAANMPILDQVVNEGGFLNARLVGDGDRTLLSIADDLNLGQGPLQLGRLVNGTLFSISDDIEQLRGLLVEAIMKITSLPAEAITNLLEILEAISSGVPVSEVISEDLRNLAAQRSLLEIYSEIEITKLVLFRDTLASLREFLVPFGEGSFLSSFNLGLLDGVRTELFDGRLTGPLENLVQPAQTYINVVFPNIGRYVEADSQLGALSTELGAALAIEQYPIQPLASLLSLKINLMNGLVDAAADGTVFIAGLTADMVQFAKEISVDLIAALPQIPGITADILFELLFVVRSIAEGVIDTKLAAIEFIARTKIDVLAKIVEIPLSVISQLKLFEIGIFQGLWEEIQGMFGMYGNYVNVLGLDTDLFPLESFASMSRGLLLRSNAAVELTQ